MKKLILVIANLLLFSSITVQAQEVTSCQNGFLVGKSEIIIGKGDVMATKNGESQSFSIGQFEVASVICRSDFFDQNSTQVREKIAVRFKLSSKIAGSIIDPNGFNSGMMTMETDFERMSQNQMVEISRMEDEILSYRQLSNGNLARKLEIPISPAYATGFQMISDSWTRDHIVPFSPYLIQGNIQNSKVREISCALRNMKAKLELTKGGESLQAVAELKNLKVCP